jgi:hypothetical protein
MGKNHSDNNRSASRKANRKKGKTRKRISNAIEQQQRNSSHEVLCVIVVLWVFEILISFFLLQPVQQQQQQQQQQLQQNKVPGVPSNVSFSDVSFLGPPATGNVTTGPQEGSPGRPEDLLIAISTSSVNLQLENGPAGKGPIVDYYIESRKKGKIIISLFIDW